LVIFFLVTLCIATLPATAQQSAGDPSAALNSLEQTAHTTASDIAHLRIDRWKVDSKSKNDAQADRDSLERNLTNALPELIGKVRRAPTDLTANFELYRNLEVLSMIFSRFAETTGAFGGKDEYSALTNDVAGLDSARKTFTARMESLTASAQAELTQYRSQAKATQAAAPPPKKIVIDDSEPEKPKAASKKKKSSKPASADASTPSTTSASAPKQ
jgi:hypothetical protein